MVNYIGNAENIFELMDILERMGLDDEAMPQNGPLYQLGAYCIVSSELASSELDKYISKYNEYIPKNIFEISWRIIQKENKLPGLLKIRWLKLGMLLTAVERAVKSEDALYPEVEKIFDACLKKGYRSSYKYASTLSKYGRDFPRYLNHLQEKVLPKDANTLVTVHIMMYCYLGSLVASKKEQINVEDIMESFMNMKVFSAFSQTCQKTFSARLEITDVRNTLMDQLNIVNKTELTKLRNRFFTRLIFNETEDVDIASHLLMDFDSIKGIRGSTMIDFLKVRDMSGFQSLLTGTLDQNYTAEWTLLELAGLDIESLLLDSIFTEDDLDDIVLNYLSLSQLDEIWLGDSIFKDIDTDYEFGMDCEGEDCFCSFCADLEHQYVVRSVILLAFKKHQDKMYQQMEKSVFTPLGSSQVNALPSENEEDKSNVQAKLIQYQTTIQNLERQIITSKDREYILAEKLEEATSEIKKLKAQLTDLEVKETNKLEEPKREQEKTIPLAEIGVVTTSKINYLDTIKHLKLCIVGGHSNFHTRLRNELEDVTIVEPRDYHNISINNFDVVVFISSYNNHGQYQRIKNILSRNNQKDKLLMIHKQPAPNTLARMIVEFMKREQELIHRHS